MNVIAEDDRLSSGQCGEYDMLIGMGISTLTVYNCSTFAQPLRDVFADRFRIIADDHNGFAQGNILNDAVDHKGFDCKSDKGVKCSLNVEDEAGKDDHQKIRDK